MGARPNADIFDNVLKYLLYFLLFLGLLELALQDVVDLEVSRFLDVKILYAV